METEIEAKWLNVDVDAFRAKLKEVGAVLVGPERLMIRKNYDFVDKRLNAAYGWVRVRDENGKITMSYKRQDNLTLHGTKEICVTVDNYDNTCSFLEHIGLKAYNYQESKRESWKLGDVEIEIDTWPWIPSFVELEAKSEDSIRDVANQLGLDFTKALHGAVDLAYQSVYDLSPREFNNLPEIRFGEAPDWLSEKLKTPQ